jgi:hypothetical protein
VAWTSALGAPGVLIDRGSGYVAVEWAGIVLVGVYVSLNSGLAAFGDFLPGTRLGGLQRSLFAMGQPQYGHTWKDVVRLRRRTCTSTSQQGLGEHMRDAEGVIRGRHHLAYP